MAEHVDLVAAGAGSHLAESLAALGTGGLHRHERVVAVRTSAWIYQDARRCFRWPPLRAPLVIIFQSVHLLLRKELLPVVVLMLVMVVMITATSA